jgi:hypothetical protein
LLGDLLDELDAEFGPVPPELLAWAERQWPDGNDEQAGRVTVIKI